MSDEDDVWDDPEVREWAQRVIRDLIPKISGSSLTISLVPKGETDVKFAVELGFSIMLDKPVILVVQPGTVLPDHLVRVADEIVELAEPLNSETGAGSRQIAAAVDRVIKRLP